MDEYVIIRSTNAGVFAGTLVKKKGDEVELNDARRLWYWSGASSLSELAVRGVAHPDKCKFPVAVPRIIVLGVIEIIPASEEARASIAAVPEWRQHD